MVISRVLSRVSILISLVRGLITPLITTHEPPSRALQGFCKSSKVCLFNV